MEQIIETIVLLVAPWPLWRLLAFPNTWRGAPGNALLLTLALAVYAVMIVSVALHALDLLRVLAAVALAALLYERWRARESYGAGGSLPPGSIGLLPLAPCRDDRFYAGQARAHGPLFKAGATFPYPSLRPMVCVAGQTRARALFRDQAEALAVAPAPRFNRLIPRGFLRYMAPSDHKHYRRILQAALSPALIERTDAQIAAQVRQSCDAMAEACQTKGAEGIAPRAPITDMLFALFLVLFFGIGRDHGAYDRLRHDLPRIGIRPRLWPASARRDDAVLAAVGTVLRDQANTVATDGTAPASVLAALVQAEPAAVQDDTVLRNLIYMVETGRHDLGGLLRWMLKLLGDNPQWLARLRAETDRRGDTPPGADSSLADRIVKECLRLEQSEYLFRRITRDIRFDGFRLPKGWVLRICVREGHRDAAVFDRPDDFDPDRFLDTAFPSGAYAPFGIDQHRCLGVTLIEAVGRHFVTVLARNFDWSVAHDGPRHFGRFHWEPNRGFRIRIAARSDRPGCATSAETHTLS